MNKKSRPLAWSCILLFPIIVNERRAQKEASHTSSKVLTPGNQTNYVYRKLEETNFKRV